MKKNPRLRVGPRKNDRHVPSCAVKTSAVRPGFVRVWWGSCGQQVQANVQGRVKQNASPGTQSEAPRRRWRPGQEQHPERENQDSQHVLNQPRGSFPETNEKKEIQIRKCPEDDHFWFCFAFSGPRGGWAILYFWVFLGLRAFCTLYEPDRIETFVVKVLTF